MKKLILLCALLAASIANAQSSVVATYSLLNRQTIQTGWSTVLDFETRVVDSHSVVTGPIPFAWPPVSWRFTAPAGGAGNYFVSFYAQWVGPIGSVSYVYLRKNGDAFRTLARADNTPGSLGLSGDTIVPLEPGDWIDLAVTQASGSPREISVGHISVFRIP